MQDFNSRLMNEILRVEILIYNDMLLQDCVGGFVRHLQLLLFFSNIPTWECTVQHKVC